MKVIIDTFFLGEAPVFIPDGSITPIEVKPFTFEVEMLGRVVFRRTIVPLVLAWAITIHKTQGLQMDQLVVDLGCCFAKGQGYTALSRVSRASGLYILRFNKHSICASPEAVAYDHSLSN